MFLVLKSLGSLFFSFNERDGMNPWTIKQKELEVCEEGQSRASDRDAETNAARLSSSESKLVIKDGVRLNICS